MAVIVVGGNTRNIGKTSVVAGLIARLPEFRWTAFKITQFGHGFCTADGHPCACQTEEACVAVNAERDPASGTDTSRFLAAGAERVFWVRTRIGRLADAMPRIREEIAAAPNAILESNSVIEFLQPDLYLTVLGLALPDSAARHAAAPDSAAPDSAAPDSTAPDFKDSARRFLPRADAILCSGSNGVALPPEFDAALGAVLGSRPRFDVAPPDWISDSLADFVRARLAAKPGWV